MQKISKISRGNYFFLILRNKANNKMKSSKNNKWKYLAVAFTAFSLLSACVAPSQRGDVYNSNQSRRMQQVQEGVILSIRPVKLEGSKTGGGSLAGSVLGGVAGGSIGHGYGQIAGAAVGAVAGALIGNAVEQGITSAEGLEILVKMSETGKTVAITQEGKPTEFSVGQRVIVLHDTRRGDARVAPVTTTNDYRRDNDGYYENHSGSSRNSDTYKNYKRDENYRRNKNNSKYPPKEYDS